MKRLYALVSLALLTACVCHAGEPERNIKGDLIKQGDTFSIELTDREGITLGAVEIVDSDGRISLPIGTQEIEAEGLTLSQLINKIPKALSPRDRLRLSIHVEVIHPVPWREILYVSHEDSSRHRIDPPRQGDFWLPGEMSPFHIAKTKQRETG